MPPAPPEAPLPSPDYAWDAHGRKYLRGVNPEDGSGAPATRDAPPREFDYGFLSAAGDRAAAAIAAAEAAVDPRPALSPAERVCVQCALRACALCAGPPWLPSRCAHPALRLAWWAACACMGG